MRIVGFKTVLIVLSISAAVSAIYLHKRSWSIIGDRERAAFAASRSNAWMGVTVTVCGGHFILANMWGTLAGCIGSAAILLLYEAAAAAGGLAPQGSETVGSRGLGIRRTAVNSDLAGSLKNMTRGTDINITSVHTITNSQPRTLIERSDEVTSPTNVVHFTSQHGTHVAFPTTHNNVTRLVEDIISATPGVLPSKSLNKRSFQADWVSYTWNDANADLSREWYDERSNMGESGEADSWFKENPSWKYCLEPKINDHPGKAIHSSYLGEGNALKGEMYFNTYGGIDSECDSKRGVV